MIIEKHNLACSMIFKAISKTGSLGSYEKFFVSIYIGRSERLAMQNLQISDRSLIQLKLGLYKSGSFHPISQTKIDLPPAVRMLYWLLPFPRKQKSNRLAMKGGGFLRLAGGN
jgi:hypothetical protein